MLVSDGLPPLLLSVGMGSAPALARGDGSDQAQRSVGRARNVPFLVGALSIPLSASPQQRPRDRQTLLGGHLLVPRERGQTAGGQWGQLRRERRWRGGCLSAWLSWRPWTRDCALTAPSPPQTVKSLENFW